MSFLMSVLIAVTLAVGAAVLGVSAAVQKQHTVTAAADNAALAAADALFGLRGDPPCRIASDVAAAHGAALTQCELAATTVQVECAAQFAGFALVARARAGSE
ncbi:helicase [Canibacter sp. lx-72]|uniref:helicase n=1 Tax=Canibacter zhuwentaonis TaxID=2837491 RepID=UPI001BDDB63E|nr:helicase [Canibacter zhuwentaonis]MBT1018526.1 helicase [Canibacter zhuwentaonis]MBT1035721.1 helicase [Canibacter zhuwentaonis]